MQDSSSTTVIPWSSPDPPTESGIRSILAQENLRPYAWGNNPGDTYQAHTHGYDKVIYVVRGSITFGLPEEDRQVTLQAGDRLELSAGTQHNAIVGEHGVLCLEAHR
jgi:quercetin dioxygenase-like cupin family protein